MNDYMLTTTDNPWNPFTHFDEWRAFDENMNYFTCEYLARIAKVSDEMSEYDENMAIEAAIDEILELNITGKYTIVFEQTKINID